MITVERGFSNGQTSTVATILYQAFRDKLGPVFGDEETCLRIISKYINRNRTFIAFNDGNLVGIAGVAYRGEDFFNPSLLAMTGDLGIRILRVIANGWVFFDKSPKDGLLLDQIAVYKDARGIGVGTRLIREVIQLAQEEGYTKIVLSVVDWNIAAKRLYTELGFRVEKTSSLIWPWSRIFNFKKADTMVLRL